MLFAGTAVANGSCLGIVNAIGMSTEVGKIQQQITEAAAEEEDTPLKKKLDVFGERLAQVLFGLQADVQVLQALTLSSARAAHGGHEDFILSLCCGLQKRSAVIQLLCPLAIYPQAHTPASGSARAPALTAQGTFLDCPALRRSSLRCACWCG